jgi:hypothetical protein
VSSTTADPVSTNNSSTWTVGASCPSAPTQTFPTSGATNVPTAGTLTWTNARASQYEVYLGPAGSGCTAATPFATVNGIDQGLVYSGLTAGAQYESRIVSLSGSCPTRSSACIQWTTACNVAAPTLISPTSGTISSPVTFQWNAVANANLYTVYASVNGGPEAILGTTSATTLTATVAGGSVRWYVAASSNTCPNGARSADATFNVCALPDAPVVGVVGARTRCRGRRWPVR